MEEAMGKMCRKGAIMEVQHQLGIIEVATDHIKDIKDALEGDYGKQEAARVIELAKLIEKGKYSSTISKANELEALKEEIFS